MISPPDQHNRTQAHSTVPAAALEALLGELSRVDERLRRQVARLRAGALAGADDQFRGLYVSDGDVDTILNGDWPLGPGSPNDLLDQPPGRSPYAPLQALSTRFQLDAFETEALLICLAPEVSLTYERLFAYVQDDVTRKRPSIDLVLNLLCRSLQHKLIAWQRFAPTASLLAHELLVAYEDQSTRHPPRLAIFLKVDERIVEFLLGQPSLDRRLAPYLRLRPYDDAAGAGLHLPDGLLPRLKALAARALQEHASPVLALIGPEGVGRQAAATQACHHLSLPLLVVDLRAIVQAADDEPPALVRRAAREARLLGAALYIDHVEALLDEERPTTAVRAALTRVVSTFPGLVLLASARDAPELDALAQRPVVPLRFPELDHAARLTLWRQHVPAHIPTDALDELAGRFQLNAGQIGASAAHAAAVALGRDPNDGAVHVDDLYAASRREATPRLGALARKITPRYRWDQIVLPPDQRAQLAEMVAQVRHRDRVLEAWGFDQTAPRGRGINALFSGPSGTGKTMAAEIMAGELGIDLYKVDLSTMVSKYIGETEKNLERLFVEAEHSSAILFFDEADAIFGKRSEVRDAHDRYANIEVGYLLQRIEEYQGIVILATNLRKNMDDAFVRRLHMSVEFPFPEEADRLAIWQLAFPPASPLAEDVDLPFMARRFKLTGGNIKNIALAAAFLAAADGATIRMAHIIRGTRREYQKLGKLVVEAEFGPYLSLLKP